MGGFGGQLRGRLEGQIGGISQFQKTTHSENIP